MSYQDDASPDAIRKLADAALAALPAQFRERLGDIVMQVEEFADAETLAAMGINSKWGLVGLYRGHPTTHQSVWVGGTMPPRIFLYRQPLLARQRRTGASLEEVVNHLVVHEVGHHFGLSDDTMHTLEDSAD